MAATPSSSMWGNFRKNPAIFESEERVKDLKKRMNNLRYWTGRYFPEFLEAMDQTIAHLYFSFTLS